MWRGNVVKERRDEMDASPEWMWCGCSASLQNKNRKGFGRLKLSLASKTASSTSPTVKVQFDRGRCLDQPDGDGVNILNESTHRPTTFHSRFGVSPHQSRPRTEKRKRTQLCCCQSNFIL